MGWEVREEHWWGDKEALDGAGSLRGGRGAALGGLAEAG